MSFVPASFMPRVFCLCLRLCRSLSHATLHFFVLFFVFSNACACFTHVNQQLDTFSGYHGFLQLRELQYNLENKQTFQRSKYTIDKDMKGGQIKKAGHKRTYEAQSINRHWFKLNSRCGVDLELWDSSVESMHGI